MFQNHPVLENVVRVRQPLRSKYKVYRGTSEFRQGTVRKTLTEGKFSAKMVSRTLTYE